MIAHSDFPKRIFSLFAPVFFHQHALGFSFLNAKNVSYLICSIITSEEPRGCRAFGIFIKACMMVRI